MVEVDSHYLALSITKHIKTNISPGLKKNGIFVQFKTVFMSPHILCSYTLTYH